MTDPKNPNGGERATWGLSRLRAWTSGFTGVSPAVVEDTRSEPPTSVTQPDMQSLLDADANPRPDTPISANELRPGRGPHFHAMEALNHSPDIVFRFRFRQDRVACRYVSPAVTPLLGLRPEQLLEDGSLFFARCHSGDRPKVRAMLSGATSGTIIARFSHVDGATLYLRLAYHRRQHDEDIWLEGTARDVTDRMAERVRYQRDNERLLAVMRATQLGIYDWELATERVHLSTRAAELLGITSGQGRYSPEAWFSRIHAEDASRVATKFTFFIRGERTQFDDEHRVLDKEGEVHWLRVTGTLLNDDKQRPTRVVGAFHDITEQKRATAELEYAATHDALTGLLNRDAFLERLADSPANAAISGVPRHSVLYVGLDQFKKINDGLGATSADAVLRELSGRLRKWLAQSHVFCGRVDGATLARFGGDEFAMLFTDVENGEELETLARQVLNLIATPINVDGQPVVVTASVGVATSFDGESSGHTMVENAQSAMYQAKSEGRSRYAYYTSAGRGDPFDVVRLESDLRLASGRDELMFYYQPLLDLQTGNLIGLEALMRWKHHERGFISPARFIPIAEQSELAIELGAWTINAVCEQLATWERMGLPKGFAVNLNLSSAHFGVSTLPALIGDTLKKYGLSGERLKLEITESALMSNPEDAIAVLTAIKALGVRICVDDFGTGYSSLSQLNRFPIDILKIDRAFVTQLDAPNYNDALARAIVAISQSLNLEVVAEGIETAYARDELAKLGCHVGQGYLFSRPVPVSDVNEWLEFGPDRCFEVTQRDLPVVPT